MSRLTPHLRYLRYVLLHKLYVYRAGVRLGVPRWRLLVHDWSKFLPSEWFPYVRKFYGETPCSTAEEQEIEAAFNRAWLFHQRRNKHHWQYWVMRLDDRGREVTLVPEAVFALEMLADWIGAGPKILRRPSLGDCARETVLWYREHASHMLLRYAPRFTIETLLARCAEEWE